MSDRATLKAFFETADVPTEAQFADLIDSLALTSEATGAVLGVENTFTKTQTVTPSPAADSLYLTGSVGIGTTDPNNQDAFVFPGTAVHIRDDVAATFMAATNGGYCGFGLLDLASATDAKYFELGSHGGLGRVTLVSADSTTYDLLHTIFCGLPTGELGVCNVVPTAGATKLQVGGGISATADCNITGGGVAGKLELSLRNTSTGDQSYAVLFLGDSTSGTSALVSLMGTNTTAYYGGARSMQVGTATTAVLGLMCNSVEKVRINTVGAIMPSSAILHWGSSTFATPDLGMGRNAAGVLEINSSSAGTLRDLKLRNIEATGTIGPALFTVGTLPTEATTARGALVHVTDEAGGEITCFNDLTDWRRMSDRAIVS